MRASEASQIRNGSRRKIDFGLIVGGESGADLQVDDGGCATEEVDKVWVEGERGCKRC